MVDHISFNLSVFENMLKNNQDFQFITKDIIDERTANYISFLG